MIQSKFRDRVLGLFKKHPTAMYRITEIENELKDVKKPVINYWIKQFLREEVIVKVKYGHYRFNEAPPDVEAIRARALELGKQSVIDSGRLWTPSQDALKVVEHPALPSRRLHFASIIERMKMNPAFTMYDVQLLETEAPHLLEREMQTVS